MKKITYISLLFFITSIFCLFMGFFGLKNTFADSSLGNVGGLYTYPLKLSSGGSYITPTTGDGKLILTYGTGLYKTQEPTYSSGTQNLPTVFSCTSGCQYYEFDDEYYNFKSLFFVYSTIVYIYHINLNNGEYALYRFSNTQIPGLNNATLSFVISGGKLVFFVNGNDFIYNLDYNLDYGFQFIKTPYTVSTIEGEITPNVLNGSGKTSRNYIYGNSGLRTCSMLSNFYSVYTWSNDLLTFNHNSIAIPNHSIGGAFGYNCYLNYDNNSNASFFSFFYPGTTAFSSYYIPGIGFGEYQNGQYVYSFNNGIVKGVNISSTRSFYGFTSQFSQGIIKPFFSPNNINSTPVDFYYYKKNGNSNELFITIDLSVNNLNTPTLSGSTITTVNNNPVNVSLNPNINNNNNVDVNIPGKCPFGKKLDPFRWSDGKWYCQVNDSTYNCPYGTDIPEFFLDGYYCEIPSQNDNNNTSSGGVIQNETTENEKGFWQGLFDNFGDKISDAITGSGQSYTGNTIDNSGTGGINSGSFGSMNVSGSGAIGFTPGTGLNNIIAGDLGESSCRMFGDNLQFLYYSNSTLSLNFAFGDYDNYFIDQISFIGEKFVGVFLSPINSAFSLVMIITPFSSTSTDYCIFGSIMTYTPHKMFVGTEYYNKFLLFDYLILFSYGIFLGTLVLSFHSIFNPFSSSEAYVEEKGIAVRKQDGSETYKKSDGTYGYRPKYKTNYTQIITSVKKKKVKNPDKFNAI